VQTPISKPVMPVTTRRQSRGLLEESNAFEESERDRSEDRTLDNSQESDDDAVAGSIMESSSTLDDEEHGSVWDEPESDVSDEESNDGVGNASESDDDFEGIFVNIKARTLC
jgi:hypothetical protein